MDSMDQDAELFSLLQEIDSASASARVASVDGYAPDSTDMLALFPAGLEAEELRLQGTTSVATSAHTPSSSHVERCRLNRKRKKRELEELREAAVVLQNTLAQLTQPQDNLSDRAGSPWRAASKNALLSYQRAVSENKRLREILQQHLTATHHIQRAIQSVPDLQPLRQVVHDDNSVSMSARSLKRPRSGSLTSLASRDLYEHLFRNIQLAYQQSSSKQETAWLQMGTRKISMEMVTQTENGTGMCIQVMECQRLQFSLAYVSDATWGHLSEPCNSEDCEDTTSCERAILANHGDDLFGECGTDCNPVPAAQDAPTGRLAIRRYLEANRLTFGWECDGCYQCDGSNKPIGRVVERGWCTFEHNDGDDGNAASTVFRIQVQYVPKSDGHVRTSSRCGAAPVVLSSDVALNLYRGTITRIFGAVGNELFKETKEGSNCSDRN